VRYSDRWYSPLTATTTATAATARAGHSHRLPSRWRSMAASKAHRAAGNAHHMTPLKWLASWDMWWGVKV
jgi:hypothetical protein